MRRNVVKKSFVPKLVTSHIYFISYPLFQRNRKVKVLERNSGFTEGLGRRLPSPDGSDQDISPYFTEGGNNPVLETGEEPVDFYRLERTGIEHFVRSCVFASILESITK